MISDEIVRQYQVDGAVCLRQVLSADWLAAIAQAVDDDMKTPGPLVRINTPQGAPGLFFVDFQLWQRHEACRRFVFDSPMATIAAQLMGSERVFWYHDHLLVKEPGTQESTPWHHDQPYYPVDGEQLVSFWIPLDPVPKDTCVEYIQGSHRWGRWFSPKYFRKDNQFVVQDPRFETIPDFDQERDRHQFLSWDMAPGDVIAFHTLSVHGAPGNRSTSRRRRAWAARWLGDDARYAARVGAISPPLEGHGLSPGDGFGVPLFPEVLLPAR
jgi:ectoine hydroxylase-related dioxygenase (phytanoyl-CoA dioxygenase family)